MVEGNGLRNRVQTSDRKKFIESLNTQIGDLPNVDYEF